MANTTAKDIILTIPDRFRSEKAGDYSTVFHLDIAKDGGGQFTVTIANGECSLEEGLIGSSKCTVSTKAKTYVDLELGKTNPQMAFMMGRVKVSDVAEMMKFGKCFYRYKEGGTEKKKDQENFATRKPQQGPLVGLRIVDLTRLLPGPLAGMLMADMGAEVIKVEDPDSPDYIRDFPPLIDGTSAYYLALNRSKRSFTLDYRSEEGVRILKKLVATADVLIEQFRPGVMEKLGLGFEELEKVNPKLIYVSITGYGQDGPYMDKAGHDLNYISYAGFTGITGNGEPAIPGGQIADVAAGSYMTVNACLAALYSRERTGEGQHVDVSMTDCTMPILTLPFAKHQADKLSIGPGEFELAGGVVNYNIYKTADDKYMALGALEPKFCNAFCDADDRTEWKLLAFTDDKEKLKELREEVSMLFASENREYWETLANKHDMCLSPVLTLAELEADKQLKHRDMIVELAQGDSQFKVIGIPLKFSKTKAAISWPAPKLGEDTQAILRELEG